jgi:hypothetical protein
MSSRVQKKKAPVRTAPAGVLSLFVLVLACVGLGLVILGALLVIVAVTSKESSSLMWVAIVGGSVLLVGAGVLRSVLDAPTEEPPRIAPAPSGPLVLRAARTSSTKRAQLALDRAVAWAEERRHRSWIALGACVAIGIQVFIPLTYYFGDDAYDERYAWRMFSAVRMHRCDVAAFETADGAERQVRLIETIHVAWITTFQRNREACMEQYLEWRCEHEDVERARLTNDCVSPDGDRVPTIVREIDCRTGAIRREGGL